MSKDTVKSPAKSESGKEKKSKTVTKSVEDTKKNKYPKVPQTAFGGKGVINLVPVTPPEIKKKQENMVSMSVNTAFSLLFLVVLTIAIAGFNLWAQLEYKVAEKKVASLHDAISSKDLILSQNKKIVDRIFIYKSIEESLYDPQTVLDYWNGLFHDFGDITSININSDLSFEIIGTANSLKDVGTLWHLLSVDQRIEEVVLDSFAKNESDEESFVVFTFVGKLNFDEFKVK
jgi:hypothetical protein